MRETFKGRLNLSDRASEALIFMVNELKEANPYIQLNASKLCSWVVENYVRNHFEKDSPRIVKSHFSPKRYVADALKNAKTEDELKVAFKDIMSKMGDKPLDGAKRPSKIGLNPQIANPPVQSSGS